MNKQVTPTENSSTELERHPASVKPGPQQAGEMLHHGLQHQSLVRPNSPAIRQDSVTYSYGHLNDLANHVAHKLLDRLGHRAALISVLYPDPAVQLVVMFGIWKAGMTALVLDANDTEQRLKRLLDDAGVDLVVSGTDLLELASRLNRNAMLLRADQCEPKLSNPDVARDPEQAAVIVYTSGSMGRPKGVIRTHRNLLGEAQRETKLLGITAVDRVSLMMPLNFSLSLKSALAALLSGSTLLPFSTMAKGISSFSDWCRAEEITVLMPPVGFFRRFLDTAQPDGSFPACRYVVLSDKIFARDVQNFRRIFSTECRLACTYGSTEAGQISFYTIGGTSPISDPIAVGAPVDGVSVRIVGVEGREKIPDRMGEIAVVSSNLSPGYWKDPVLTEQRYKDLPEGVHGRMCMTGDIGIIGEDGLIYLYGRRDNQLKIRDCRVDLGEIETVLNETQGVAHAVVTVSENNAGEKTLTAYVSLSGEPKMQPPALREIAATRLPGYMLPDNIIVIDEIPSTSRGKVGRDALASLNMQVDREVSTRPTTELEKRIIEVWEEIFEIENISTFDDILDLGVNSLAAMRMCLKLNSIFSIEIPFSQLVLSPTVEELAAFIDAKKVETGTQDNH